MLQHRYTWTATLKDGQTLTEGADLTQAAMISLIPSEGARLPRHDIAGVPLKRRFARGFVRGLGGGLKEYVHCIVADHFRVYVRASDGTVLVTPPDYELYL